MYYQLPNGELYQVDNGYVCPVAPEGQLIYSSNGDGTCKVTGIEDYYNYNIVIPEYAPNGERVIAIGTEAFANKVFDTLTVPSTLTSIGNYAFKSVTCRNIDLSAAVSLTNIGESTFLQAFGPLTVTIPNTVTEISRTFAGFKTLSEIIIPNTVTQIGVATFNGCTNLKDVIIGTGVAIINTSAFGECTLLKNIRYSGTMEQWNDIAKIDGWNTGSAIQTIICSNGTINLDEEGSEE
jgi:hypothetical protein